MEGVSLAGVVGMGGGSRSPGISRPLPLVAGSVSARGISIAPAVDDLAAFFRLFAQPGAGLGFNRDAGGLERLEVVHWLPGDLDLLCFPSSQLSSCAA